MSKIFENVYKIVYRVFKKFKLRNSFRGVIISKIGKVVLNFSNIIN